MDDHGVTMDNLVLTLQLTPADLFTDGAERYLLGLIMPDPTEFPIVNSLIQPEDFCINAHRLIFTAIKHLFERNENIDRVTVCNELLQLNELENAGGIQYVVSLDDARPETYNIEPAAKLIRDKAVLRRLVFKRLGI
jgi:replicative DNA helicase